MRPFSNFRYKLLSLVISAFIWFSVQGAKEDYVATFEIPVVLEGIPGELVATQLSADTVNLRIKGSRTALNILGKKPLEFALEAGSAKQGEAEFRVNLLPLERDLPQGAQVESHSPANISVNFDKRTSRRVRVRAELTGAPASGFQVASILVDPPLVAIEGADAEILRIQEVLTETVNVDGLESSITREVGVFADGDNVWVRDPKPVRVKVAIEEAPPEEVANSRDPDPS